MRALALIFGLFFFINLNAASGEDSLQIVRDGFVIIVVNFNEGDKIKLFEVETGDHVLSKTRGEIDLSQLPSGKYLLENNEGKSAIVEKTDFDIVVEEELGTDFIVANDCDRAVPNDLTIEEELEEIYIRSEVNPLHIEREGDLVTVIDFEEGDKIKLFEVVGKIHVLTKTTKLVDLMQLTPGKYIIENNKGQSTVVEKFDIEFEYDETIVAFN